MRILHRVWLPIMLIVSVVAAEIAGMFLCRRFIPDGKGKLYTQVKNTSAQLLIVDDEDNARFYPRIPEDDNDSISIEQYMEQQYRTYYGESEKFGNIFDSTYSYAQSLLQYASGLEKIVTVCIRLFSGLECTDTEKIVRSYKINTKQNIVYLREVPIKTDDGKTHLLSIVFDLNNIELLFYRLSPVNTDIPNVSAVVGRKGKSLVNDFTDLLPVLKDLLLHDRYELSEKTDDMFYYEIEKTMMPEDDELFENKFDISYDDMTPETESGFFCMEIGQYLNKKLPLNEAAQWISSILFRLADCKNIFVADGYVSYEEKYDRTDNYDVSSLTFIETDDISFSVRLPADLPDREYHVFSSGDELMIVFESPQKSSIILYYSVTEQTFTGFCL